MPRKDRIDAAGGAMLFGVMLLLAANQIIVKIVNEGLQPVFFAGLRSVLAVGFVAGWLWLRGRPVRYTPGTWRAGLLIGTVFAAEFLCLFLALDLTTVGRAAIIFYSMPIWFALLAHFGLPDERITPIRAAGLAMAFGGTAWAIFDRSGGGAEGSLAGDLLALGGALGWAGTAFMTRLPPLKAVGAEMQLFWMVLVSGPILLMAAPLFGPLIRDLQPVHLFWLVFQASVVVAGGFIAWLSLLAIYPASSVASFSFLTPVLSLTLGAVVFGESLSAAIIGSAVLVAGGIVLINRKG